jgi:competence protein ComEC
MAKRTKCSNAYEHTRPVSANGLAVHFLDVGQGDCTVVTTGAQDASLVVDCTCFRCALELLKNAGWPELTVIITHWDRDHISGIAHLVLNYQGTIRAIYYNSFDRLDHERRTIGASQIHGSVLYGLVREADARGIAIHANVRPPDPVFGTPQKGATVIYPTPEELGEAVKTQKFNMASIVLEVRCGPAAVALGADLPPSQWLQLARQGRFSPVIALKVPHHGTRVPQNFVKEIAATLGPRLAVISVGTGNQYKHPHRRSLRQWGAVCRVLCTEVTNHCCSDAMPERAEVLALLRQRSSPAVAAGCPCAGTVVIDMDEEGYRVYPQASDHEAVISLFGAGQCRAERG